MPRIPPSLLRQASKLNPHLAQLLPICRDLGSAQNELRWLSQHAVAQSHQSNLTISNRLLDGYLKRRAKGEPLQYILGSEYFGNLEIRCRPGVLIPRQETARSVSWLVERMTSRGKLRSLPKRLRVLDLCTGSGCIPLNFHDEFYKKDSASEVALELVGVDISTQALNLAEENKAVQLDSQLTERSESSRALSLRGVRFLQANVLSAGDAAAPSLGKVLKGISLPKTLPEYDILISNPPYISTKAFKTTTSASVKRYEPKLALVPPSSSTTDTVEDGDLFYPRLLEIADTIKAKVFLFEVAELSQAKRVATMAVERGVWDTVEIWRDEPTGCTPGDETQLVVGDSAIRILGQGHGRTVVAYRGIGTVLFSE